MKPASKSWPASVATSRAFRSRSIGRADSPDRTSHGYFSKKPFYFSKINPRSSTRLVTYPSLHEASRADARPLRFFACSAASALHSTLCLPRHLSGLELRTPASRRHTGTMASWRWRLALGAAASRPPREALAWRGSGGRPSALNHRRDRRRSTHRRESLGAAGHQHGSLPPASWRGSRLQARRHPGAGSTRSGGYQHGGLGPSHGARRRLPGTYGGRSSAVGNLVLREVRDQGRWRRRTRF